MPDYKYEMMYNGHKLVGRVRAESEEALIADYTKKGATNIKLTPFYCPQKDWNYTATDINGKKVKGTIKGIDEFQIHEKLEELEQYGYKDFILAEKFMSSLKNFFRKK